MAKQLYEQLAQKIEQLAHIREHFATATAFEQQGNYRKALEELEKVQRIDRNHPELPQRMANCRLKISEQEENILRVKQEYALSADRQEHEKAAAYAHQLVALLDVEFQAEWIAREEQHKRAAEAEQKQKEFIDDCTKRYNEAWFDGDWAAFVRYAEEVLRCRKDEELAERVERAKKRVRAELDRQQFEEALKRVKVLIADRNYEEARRLLNALKADATTPEQLQIVRNLFSRIFDEEDQKKDPSPEPPQQPADQPSGIHNFGDFFGEREAPKPAARPKKADAETKPAPDEKQKKGAKDETKKGFSLNEFDF